MTAPLWTLRNVRYGYAGTNAPALHDVTLDVGEGRITAIIGPNGAGKSTLLHIMLGVLPANAGSVGFRGSPLPEWDRRALAREVAVVPQGETEPLFSVRELVGMGRYAHLGPWQREREEDVAAITRAMERCDVSMFADRWLTTLSGGERQRVRLARALAQEAPALVLDEPTTSLDIRHEMTIFALLRALRAEQRTIVIATHNLNLAARFADDVVLMHRGTIVARGAPRDVFTTDTMARVYEWPVEIVEHRDGAPQVVPDDSVQRTAYSGQRAATPEGEG